MANNYDLVSDLLSGIAQKGDIVVKAKTFDDILNLIEEMREIVESFDRLVLLIKRDRHDK